MPGRLGGGSGPTLSPAAPPPPCNLWLWPSCHRQSPVPWRVPGGPPTPAADFVVAEPLGMWLRAFMTARPPPLPRFGARIGTLRGARATATVGYRFALCDETLFVQLCPPVVHRQFSGRRVRYVAAGGSLAPPPGAPQHAQFEEQHPDIDLWVIPFVD